MQQTQPPKRGGAAELGRSVASGRDVVQRGKGDAIRTLVGPLLAQAVANAIVALAIVVVAFALTGRSPPPELLVGSSIGGALSPVAWQTYRAIRPHRDGLPRGAASGGRGQAAAVDPDAERVAAADGGGL